MDTFDTYQRVLKAVYFPKSKLLVAELGSHPSQVWWSILEGRDVLHIGLIKRIGDGVQQMHGIWTGFPRDTRLRPIAPCKTIIIISQPMAAWNLQNLAENFLSADIEVLQNIPLSHRRQWFLAMSLWVNGSFFQSARVIGLWIWQWESARLAWWTNDTIVCVCGWGSLAEALENQGSSNVRIFLWRLAHHSLLTNDVRERRYMA
jgi:hypothetical protein